MLPSPEATADLARRIAPLLRPGHTILLSGPIGAGKTHFARALIQARLAAAGLAEDVPSPTFTLVQVYDVDGAAIWHADLYRLTDPGEAAELGLEEAFQRAICLVEWPDRLGAQAPSGALTLTFAPDGADESRTAHLTARGSTWNEVFRAAESTAHA
jgi:tRNA threonylcarbamoyl adenosine modification protein YjeE